MKEILINIAPAVCIGFLMQLVLHELGHLIGGLLTGWKIIYLQLFYMIIARENKKLKFKITSTCDYQCIMYPKTLGNSVWLYTIGGCALNLATAFLGLAGILLFLCTNALLFLYSLCFFVFGLTSFLINIIPNTKRICNDGASLLLLKDRQTRLCHNSQLFIAKELFEGKTYRQIDRELLFNLCEQTDNDILAYQAVLEYYYWLELEDYERMNQTLAKINMNSPISQSLSDLILLEKLYVVLIQSIKEKQSFMLDKASGTWNIQEFIKKHETRGDVHSLRVNTTVNVFEMLKIGKKEKALDIIDGSVKKIKRMNCVYSGEALFCLDQVAGLKKLCQM